MMFEQMVTFVLEKTKMVVTQEIMLNGISPGGKFRAGLESLTSA